MKTSIRSRKFLAGMVLFVAIILLLSVTSAYYLNNLSSKTSAILKENHVSVVYARDMSNNLLKINTEITNCYIQSKAIDTILTSKTLVLFEKSLFLEKNNITEVGEDTLALNIEKNYLDFKAIVNSLYNSPIQADKVLLLQNKFISTNHKLMLLSQMNESAIKHKTDDAKISAKKATLQMTLIGTICFLIAYGYTFIFSSYFNERFYKLYNGIKDLSTSNYIQQFNISGNDELSEIAVIVNQMADKLSKSEINLFSEVVEPLKNNISTNELEELKVLINNIKTLEKEAIELVSKIENKNP